MNAFARFWLYFTVAFPAVMFPVYASVFSGTPWWVAVPEVAVGLGFAVLWAGVCSGGLRLSRD